MHKHCVCGISFALLKISSWPLEKAELLELGSNHRVSPVLLPILNKGKLIKHSKRCVWLLNSFCVLSSWIEMAFKNSKYLNADLICVCVFGSLDLLLTSCTIWSVSIILIPHFFSCKTVIVSVRHIAQYLCRNWILKET